jgi:hypothetical protein
MCAFPNSDMPGHRRLHDRVLGALDICQEGQGIDFKESAPWDSLKWRIIKTALAMGNLRDGGIIVVGSSEREQTWDLSGITQDHLVTFDVDNIIDAVNSYASPHVDLDIALVKHNNGHQFLAIQVNEFDNTLIVCKKNGPAGTGIVEGAVYVRPPGIAKTTRVMNASQMHDMLELAAEKRARRILETARRVGLTAKPAEAELFDIELEGL